MKVTDEPQFGWQVPQSRFEANILRIRMYSITYTLPLSVIIIIIIIIGGTR
jgi:hypothetical protein